MARIGPDSLGLCSWISSHGNHWRSRPLIFSRATGTPRACTARRYISIVRSKGERERKRERTLRKIYPRARKRRGFIRAFDVFLFSLVETREEEKRRGEVVEVLSADKRSCAFLPRLNERTMKTARHKCAYRTCEIRRDSPCVAINQWIIERRGDNRSISNQLFSHAEYDGNATPTSTANNARNACYSQTLGKHGASSIEHIYYVYNDRSAV